MRDETSTANRRRLLRAVLTCMAMVSPLAAAAPVSAGFVGYIVTAIDIEAEGKQLTVFTLAARFDGPRDTVLLVHRLKSENPADYTGFWHRDARTLGDAEGAAPLRQDAGTWDPAQVPKAKVNREFDSYLTIGGECGMRNASSADPSWARARRPEETPETRGWHRPDIPATGIVGWYAPASAASGQSRVGGSPNYLVGGKPTLVEPSTDVRIAQFVLSKDDAPREFTLTLAFNDGSPESPLVSATGRFTLGRTKIEELPPPPLRAERTP